jgi:hypothetical protein
MELFSDGSDSESKKCKRGYMVALMVWSGLHLAGVWSLESGGLFSVGTFCKNLASAATKMISRSIYFIKTCNKLCTLNAICKDKLHYYSTKGRLIPVKLTLVSH